MTPDQIQDAARRKYNVVSDTFYNDDFFYDSIFEAETELAIKAKVIEKIYSTTSVADQREYSWPTNAIAINRIEYNGTKLRLTDFREDDALTLSQASTTQTGTPEFYQLWGRVIYLRQIPGTSGLTIKIFTYDLPSLQSTGGATLDTPAHLHSNIVNFVTSCLALKNQDASTAQFYRSLWDNSVIEAIRWQARKKRTDGFARVKNVDEIPSTHLGVT